MSAASRHRKLFVTALLAVLALMVPVACGDDDSAVADSPDPAGASNSDSGDSDSPEPDDEADDSDEADSTTSSAPTTSAPEILSGDECLVGKWQVDNDQWGQMFQTLGQAEEASFQVLGVTGLGTTEYRADGTTETIYDEWTITATVADAPGELSITRNGVDQGTWGVADGRLTMLDTEVTSVVTATMGGMSLPAGGGGGTNDPSLIAGEADFDCNGDALTVVVDGHSLLLNRIG